MNRQREPRSLNLPLLGEGLARIYRGILAVVGALRPAKEPPAAPAERSAAPSAPPEPLPGRRGSRAAPAGKRGDGPGRGTRPAGCPRGLGWAGQRGQAPGRLCHPSDLLGSSLGQHFPGICCGRVGAAAFLNCCRRRRKNFVGDLRWNYRQEGRVNSLSFSLALRVFRFISTNEPPRLFPCGTIPACGGRQPLWMGSLVASPER